MSGELNKVPSLSCRLHVCARSPYLSHAHTHLKTRAFASLVLIFSMLTTEILNESKRLLERPLDEDSGHQSDCLIKSQFFPKGAVYFSQVDLTFLSLSFLTWEMEPFTVRPTLEGVSYQVQQLSGRTSGYLHCERGKGVSPEQGLWHVTDDFFFLFLSKPGGLRGCRRVVLRHGCALGSRGKPALALMLGAHSWDLDAVGLRSGLSR